MKIKLLILFICILTLTVQAQKKTSINLTNALIVGQFDKEDDRYNLEVTLTEFFTQHNVNAVPSLNVLKQGADLRMLALDTLKREVMAKGIDTYLLCSVRGYDRKFKKTTKNDDFETALSYGTLFSLFRQDVVSVTFEFFVYRENKLVFTQLIKCGNVSSKEKVLERLRKKLEKKFRKW